LGSYKLYLKYSNTHTHLSKGLLGTPYYCVLTGLGNCFAQRYFCMLRQDMKERA